MKISTATRRRHRFIGEFTSPGPFTQQETHNGIPPLQRAKLCGSLYVSGSQATMVWTATEEAFFAHTAAPMLVLILLSSLSLHFILGRQHL